jgi:hypothetical protein
LSEFKEEEEEEEEDEDRWEEEGWEEEVWRDPARTFYRVLNPPLRSWNEKFGVEETELTYTLSKKAVRLAEKGFSLEVMTKVLEEIMGEYTRNDDGSFVQICLNSFSLDFPINVRVSSDPELALRQVLDQIERTLSSKDSVRAREREKDFVLFPFFFSF